MNTFCLCLTLVSHVILLESRGFHKKLWGDGFGPWGLKFDMWLSIKMTPWAPRYDPQTEEVSQSVWQLHNSVSHEEQSCNLHRCSFGRLRPDAAENPHTHFERRIKELLSSSSKQRGRAEQQGRANRDNIGPFWNKWKEGATMCSSKTRYGLIWQFTGGEKKKGNNFLELHSLIQNRWVKKVLFRLVFYVFFIYGLM